MKKFFFYALIVMLVSQVSFASQNAAKLQHPLKFIIEKTLALKNKKYNPAIPLPTFHFSSSTPLVQFQDAIEKQWGFRPDFITNAYAFANNEIYIMDDFDYYETQKRCIDDSVSHEIVHYIQDKYMGWDLNDESLEWDAIEIQTQFREKYCKIP